MISITSEPPSLGSNINISTQKQPPVPVSDCFRWCLQADTADAITTPGSQASVVILFPAVCSVPANGTAFKIWGVEFTVQNSSDYTSNSFKVETVGVLTFLNFAYMIASNLFFNRALTMSAVVVGSDFELTLTWNECRAQERFSAPDMDFAALDAGVGTTSTFTNGSSPVYVEGFKIIARPIVFEGETISSYPLGPLEALEVDLLCSSVADVCVDFRPDFEQQLFTRLPDLTATSFIDEIENGRSLMKFFGIEYGWIYRTNCQAQSGTIQRSGRVLGINAALPIEDQYGMRRYWHDHPEGYPPGQTVPEFLTYQPKSRHTLCLNSFSWLWLTNNFQRLYGINYRLVARFRLYKKGFGGFFEEFRHTVMNSDPNKNTWYQAICFNTSPAFVLLNAPTLTSDNLIGYEVQVFGENSAGAVLFTASESLRFEVVNACNNCTDVYFLTSPGGIGTQPVTIKEKEVVSSGNEIKISTSCDLSNTDRARYGGRTLVSLRSYERVTFEVNLPNTPEHERWIKDLRKSPQTWLKVSDFDGRPLARKMILDSGAVKIFKTGEGISVEMTGYLSDIPTQKGVEP